MNPGSFFAVGFFAGGTLIAGYWLVCEVRAFLDRRRLLARVAEQRWRELSEPLWRFGISAPPDLTPSVADEFACTLSDIRSLPTAGR